MENYDVQLEQRVWKRVLGSDEKPRLQTMAAEEQARAAVFLMLSRMAQGPEKAKLKRLFEEERIHARRLKGIALAGEGTALSVQTAAPENERAETGLRKCYGRALKAIAAYEAWSADPEFGCVFRRMAAEEAEHAALIMELLGSLGR